MKRNLVSKILKRLQYLFLIDLATILTLLCANSYKTLFIHQKIIDKLTLPLYSGRVSLVVKLNKKVWVFN